MKPYETIQDLINDNLLAEIEYVIENNQDDETLKRLALYIEDDTPIYYHDCERLIDNYGLDNALAEINEIFEKVTFEDSCELCAYLYKTELQYTISELVTHLSIHINTPLDSEKLQKLKELIG